MSETLTPVAAERGCDVLPPIRGTTSQSPPDADAARRALEVTERDEAAARRALEVTERDEAAARRALEVTERDEAAARRALRTQIARLERDLAAQGADLRARRPASFAAALELRYAEPRRRAAAPRLLSLGELEAERDELARRLREDRAAHDAAGAHHEDARALREEMLLDPAAHRYVRVSNADVGEPGCHDFHVRPRFGLLGMLMRWWRVRISSGCP